MTHIGHDFPEKLFKLITNAVSAFLLIVIFYIVQYIFDMHFMCSCLPGIHLNGVLYMLVPPLILTWVVYIIEAFHQRKIVSSCQRLCCNTFCSSFLKLLINYFSLLFVWVATVLFDGDWYFCLRTNLNPSQTGIPCKANLSQEEKLIEDRYKIESLNFGFFVIFFLLVLWGVCEILGAYCVRKKTWGRGSWSELELCCPPHYRVVYEDLLEEQVSSHLKDELTNIAAERAKAICKPLLRVIRDHEDPFTCDGNDNGNDRVSEAWKKISASDFPLMEHERIHMPDQRR